MSPRTGRPKLDEPRVHIGIRIPADLEKRLNAYCKAQGITRTEAIEQGIHLLLGQEKK